MTAEKYKVADITLADFGRKEIEIAGTIYSFLTLNRERDARTHDPPGEVWTSSAT